MKSHRLALACLAPLLVATTACPSQATPPVPANAAGAKGSAAAGPPAAAADAVAGAPTATPPAPATSPAAVAPAPGAAEPTALEAPPAPAEVAATPDALGLHQADPRWFRKTIFADKGTVLDTKRSEADAQGRFSSLIRFELQGMDVEACADHLAELVKDEIPTIERTPKDGRIQLSGSTDQYNVTFMCGEAQGKTIAYVSYAWT